jgi:hypothetical protein
MAKKIPIYDERMLLLMRHCVDSEICDSQADFLESLGLQPPVAAQIKRGDRSFTIDQVITAARLYKININWICGLSKEMKLQSSKTALQQLKDATRAVEAELSSK